MPLTKEQLEAVAINDPDKYLAAGGTLSNGQIPQGAFVNRAEVSYLNSDTGKSIYNQNIKDLDAVSKTIEDNKTNQEALKKEQEEKQKVEEEKQAEIKTISGNTATGQGANAQGTKGEWITNPKTGINQFFPEGSTITFEEPKTEEDTELDKEGNNLKLQMDQLKLTQDKITSVYIDAITQKYEQLKEQQKEINRRAYARVQTAGLRTGTARYAPEIQSGILSAEESSGLAKISKLESEKMTLIAEAQQAKQNKDVEMLYKKMEDYNARRKEQNELLKEQAKNAEKNREDKAKKLEQFNIVLNATNLIKKGITDPSDIISNLNKLGISTTAEDLKKVMDLFPEEKSQSENIGKIYQSALNLNAPQDILDSILTSSDTVSAYKAAGKYAQNAGGIIGEYNLAKLQGYTGTFNDYQTIDSNRKAKAAVAFDASGMTPKQNQVFNSIADKLRNSPLMKANDRTIVLKTISDEIKQNPTDGALQLSLIYSFIQALDTYQSAVREGEIGLTQSLLGWMGKLEIYKSNVEDQKKILDEKTSLSIAKTADLLIKTIEEGAKRTENDFEAQARINKFDTQWKEYRNTVKELNKTPIEVEAQQNENTAKQKVIDYGNNNPDMQEKITSLLSEGNYSYSDIFDILTQ